MNPTHTDGVFTISLDFELYWGMKDVVDIDDYKKNLEGVEDSVNSLLNLFQKYTIHTTWAPIGFLFFSNLTSLQNNAPKLKPTYTNPNYNLYDYMQHIKIEKYHFVPNMIEKIARYKNQEIGTHTFSHYYCLEKGQTIEQFRADISAAISITKKKLHSDIKSLIFPRNQWNEEYLSVLLEYDIICFRGTENHWIYHATNKNQDNLLKRALRLIDAHINLTGHHTYALDTITSMKPYNLHASRFLRPVSQTLPLFENLRLRRILDSMTYAAKTKQIYHLWWHPHNFGSNLKENIQFLKKILEHYTLLHKQYNMQSLNMKEIALLLDTKG